MAIIKLLMLFTDLLFTVPFKKCYVSAKPVILEPIMLVELKAPTEFQGTVTGDINKFVSCYFFFFCYWILLLSFGRSSDFEYAFNLTGGKA